MRQAGEMRETNARVAWSRRATGAACVVALFFALGGGTVAGAPLTPTTKFRDPVHKFSFGMFDGWLQIPLETQGKGQVRDPLEKFRAVRFSEGGKQAGRGSSIIEVFQMGKPAGVPVTTGEKPTAKPPDKPADPAAPPTRVLPKEPASMAELFNQLLDRMRIGNGRMIDPKTGKDLKSKDGVPGKTWVVAKSADVFMVFAIWEKDDVEVGMWLACEGPARKEYELGFTRIVASFKWFDDRAEDVRSLDVLDGCRISAKKKREIEKGLVKGWDVIVSPNKNYVIIYNTNGKRNNSLARTLSERIEAIRAQVYETQFPPSKPVEAVSIVRICGNALEYHAYGGPGGSAGYWSDDSEELVFFDMSPGRAVDDDTLAVLYHEAFHQFVYYSVGQVAPHSWFNEGHGDYYAGSKIGDGKFTIKPFRWRVKAVKDAMKAGPIELGEIAEVGEDAKYQVPRDSTGYVPLKALVRFTQGEYYSYPRICYAEGWSLVYFLREIVPKNPDWNAKWGKILEVYFRTLKEEVNKEKPLTTPSAAPATPGTGDPGMDEPGMSEPGMGEPGMGEPGMSEPGMSEPGMGEPGMDEPGMGEPGMSEPGMGDPAQPPAPGGEDEEPAIPMAVSRIQSSVKALKEAVTMAFAGVNFQELEAAWKDSILKLKDPPPRRPH